MTGTNHALTGAVVALAVKQPVAAVVLAFLSHFAIDLIPHYNPKGITRHVFTTHTTAYHKKFKDPWFKYIFWLDMSLLFLIMVTFPFLLVSDVSSWTIFLAMSAAILPDMMAARFQVYKFLGFKKSETVSWFSRSHVRLQLLERPWGIYVEAVWYVLMLFALRYLVT